MKTYLLADAGRFRLLISPAPLSADPPETPACRDLARELGGGAATVWVAEIGVSQLHGLIELAEHDFTPLPALLGATRRHVDAITRDKLAGRYAFRFRRTDPDP